MGELFMRKPDGEEITIDIDGTMVKEIKPIEIDWCDKCETWQPLAGGYTLKSDGLALIWYCEGCK